MCVFNSKGTHTMTIWKGIPGYSDYEVSENGDVRVSHSRNFKRKSNRGSPHKKGGDSIKSRYGAARGYITCDIKNDNGVIKQIGVHHLVALAFHGPRPKGMFALHADDVKRNNHYSNIRWGTPLDNNIDFVKNGKCKNQYGEPKFTAEIATEIRNRHKNGEIIYRLAKEFKVNYYTIWDLVKKRSYKWVP